jgi:hypothetical protein
MKKISFTLVTKKIFEKLIRKKCLKNLKFASRINQNILNKVLKNNG